jgi:hypothetical protein
VVLQVCDQLGHGLLGDLGPFGEASHRCPAVVDVLEDRGVSRSHRPVPALGQPDQCALVEGDVRLTQEHDRVRSASHLVPMRQ